MCGCNKNRGKKYVWVSQDASRTKTFTEKMQARAQVIHEEMKHGKGNGGTVTVV